MVESKDNKRDNYFIEKSRVANPAFCFPVTYAKKYVKGEEKRSADPGE
jgi:hypothetical protein